MDIQSAFCQLFATKTARINFFSQTVDMEEEFKCLCKV